VTVVNRIRSQLPIIRSDGPNTNMKGMM